MGTKSRETIYGGSVRAAAERATEARKEADRLACEAWNKRMLGFQGPAQPSPALGDALNAGYRYLEVRCLGCDTHQTVALDIVRRPKTTPVHELERYMRCKDCSEVRGYPYKRSHLVALRSAKISASDPPSTWWPWRAVNVKEAGMGRAKNTLPLLAILFLAMLSNGERLGHVAKAQTIASVLAAQIRSQGFACDVAQKATRDAKLSKPDYEVWVLTCKNATYRIGRYPDLAAKVEKLK
jgi:hypothetical protein